MRKILSICTFLVLLCLFVKNSSADDGAVQQIKQQINILKQQRNLLLGRRSELQGLIGSASQTNAIQEKLDNIEKISNDPEFWEYRGEDDQERVELAAQFENPEDIKNVYEKMEQEKQKLVSEINGKQEELDNAGLLDWTETESDERDLAILNAQLDIKNKAIDELKNKEDVREFQQKDAETQTKELLETKEQEKETHQTLVKQEAKLQELEKEVSDADNEGFGLAKYLGLGADEKKMKELEEQRKKVEKIQDDFDDKQEEMVVKACSDNKVEDKVVQEVVDHAVNRLEAQHKITVGMQETNNLQDELAKKETAKGILKDIKNQDPVASFQKGVDHMAQSALNEQKVLRQEDKLIKQADVLKKGMDARAEQLNDKLNTINKDVAENKISQTEADKETEKIQNQLCNDAATATIANAIQEEQLEKTAKKAEKETFSGVSAAWNEETHGTKTGFLYKGYQVASAFVGDAATVIVDAGSDATDGELLKSKGQTINEDMEKRYQKTNQIIKTMKEYQKLDYNQKTQIRDNVIYDKDIKDKKTQKVFENLNKNYLNTAGAEGVKLLNQGRTPKTEKEALLVSLAEAKADVKNDEKTYRNILINEHRLVSATRDGKKMSLNPFRVLGDKLTAHEQERTQDYLEETKNKYDEIESLQSDLQMNVADSGDTKKYLNSTRHGLALNAELEKQKINKKINDIDKKIQTASYMETLELRKQKEKLMNVSEKKVNTYLNQSQHLEAENMVRQGDIYGANAKYEELAKRNPSKQGSYQGLVKANKEYMETKKNNEMSKLLFEKGSFDATIALVGGGATKTIKAQKGVLNKVKTGLLQYGKVLNPATGLKGVAHTAVTKVKVKAVSQITGIDEELVGDAFAIKNAASTRLEVMNFKRSNQQTLKPSFIAAQKKNKYTQSEKISRQYIKTKKGRKDIDAWNRQEKKGKQLVEEMRQIIKDDPDANIKDPKFCKKYKELRQNKRALNELIKNDDNYDLRVQVNKVEGKLFGRTVEDVKPIVAKDANGKEIKSIMVNKKYEVGKVHKKTIETLKTKEKAHIEKLVKDFAIKQGENPANFNIKKYIDPKNVRIEVFNATSNKQAPDTMGNDHDNTFHVVITRGKGKGAKLDVSSDVARPHYGRELHNVLNPGSKKVLSNKEANEFTHKMDNVVMDKNDPGAYHGKDFEFNKLLKKGQPYKFSKATSENMAHTVAYKGIEFFNLGRECRDPKNKHYDPDVALTHDAEGMRQIVKQWNKYIKPRHQTRGVKVPKNIEKFIKIMEKVGEPYFERVNGKLEKRTFSPSEAETQLKALGYTKEEVAVIVGQSWESLVKLES